MANLILLFVCLLLGVLLRKGKLMPENGYVALNAYVVNISIAALTLYYIPKLDLDLKVVFPIGVAWLNIFLAIIFFSFLSKKMGWCKSITGALIMCAGFGNTSFIGIPVIQALYGENGLKTVMLVDQPGSFVALSTLGIAVANFYSGSHNSAVNIAKKMLRFPPFIAFVIAVVLNILNVDFPTVIDEVLGKLGATTVPLALVSVGLQLRIPQFGEESKSLFLGLLFKLIIFPLSIFMLYMLVLKQKGEMIEVSIMEAAMAPMITAGIIASSHNLEPKLCNLMIVVGIPLSFITLAGWYFLMAAIH